ncbi:MAG: hypothetical protein WA823_14950, partial [Candidatus Acidiferrales bacterium]
LCDQAVEKQKTTRSVVDFVSRAAFLRTLTERPSTSPILSLTFMAAPRLLGSLAGTTELIQGVY